MSLQRGKGIHTSLVYYKYLVNMRHIQNMHAHEKRQRTRRRRPNQRGTRHSPIWSPRPGQPLRRPGLPRTKYDNDTAMPERLDVKPMTSMPFPNDLTYTDPPAPQCAP